MKVKQKQGTRGSLKWLQLCVNGQPEVLQHVELGDVTWLSPLKADDYAEYRDAAFLDCVKLGHHAHDLAAFWPARGPQWDALGRAGDKVVLVEAKAYLKEMVSTCAAGEASKARISAAFRQVCDDLGVLDHTPWLTGYYQLANRIAHLWFLRQAGVDAHLLLVGFVNDADMKGPTVAAKWETAYRVAEAGLGIAAGHKLSPYIHHIYPDVRRIGVS
ncbi:hypothetical protein ABI_17580 [Asticcacaulis biprosthecium C19]|uniref:Uncharacterized protein n=1 Tax=Asticcacaulis biprosthecium C19 TaxID=715226 RepID=F4QKL6_9CAUL|nr:hypothetical protein [Asticcacaulis biprosthecium]EGF93318.1 hypothetical protein ABI_17580 [Asticcacaulis biprosthecium C19]